VSAQEPTRARDLQKRPESAWAVQEIFTNLFVVTVGSVVLGFVLSRVIVPLTARIRDVPIAVVVQFCGTFAVWMLAERLHLSGILTVVVFAMASTQRAGDTIRARVRIPSYAVWEFAVFVLNVLAFILVGFQLKAILGRIDTPTMILGARSEGPHYIEERMRTVTQ
jgi:CPA1 family monovalent cation:H+ antiporter